MQSKIYFVLLYTTLPILRVRTHPDQSICFTVRIRYTNITSKCVVWVFGGSSLDKHGRICGTVTGIGAVGHGPIVPAALENYYDCFDS